jgi:RNA polymerase sigma-70 factor (ECF subfamily)
MTDPTDRIYERLLVLRCQVGDEAAFAEIVHRYDRRLRYYLRRMVSDRDRVEDVLQDVWLAVFRGIAKLMEPAALAAWLYRISRDKAALQQRRRDPITGIAEEDLPDAPAVDDNFSPDEAAQVHSALEGLDAEHREVLVLRFLEEMTYEDMARVTGCPIGTVRSRLHYAKLALRRAIERMNCDE